MTRFRVGFTTVMGTNWFDLNNRKEAIKRAQAEKKAGAINVRVMEEHPWPPGEEEWGRYAANFKQIWP